PDETALDAEQPPAPVEAHSLAHWAEKQVGSSREAKQTLAWMAREGEGDKLERIAADDNVPAARVRQRVSRMRRWMKQRWMAELALVAALGVIAFLVYRALRRPNEAPIAVPEPQPTAPPSAPLPNIEPSPMERARALRADAFERCDAAD